MGHQQRRERLEDLIFAGSWTGAKNEQQRFTQDSPILPQVWLAFAGFDGSGAVDEEQELLINPFQGKRAGLVARELRELTDAYRQALSKKKDKRTTDRFKDHAKIAHVPGLVAAKLYFPEVLRIVLPSTVWWKHRVDSVKQALNIRLDQPDQKLLPFSDSTVKTIAAWLKNTSEIEVSLKNAKTPDLPIHVGLHCRDFLALIRLAVAILEHPNENSDNDGHTDLDIVTRFNSIYDDWPSEQDHPPTRGLIWNVALDRGGDLQAEKSCMAIKADAARHLFDISCSKLRWAVIDSGIDIQSPAFRDWRQPGDGHTALTGLRAPPDQQQLGHRTRVVDCYDFMILRNLLDLTTAGRLKKVAKDVYEWMNDQDPLITELSDDGSDDRELQPSQTFWTGVKTLVGKRSEMPEGSEFYETMIRRLIETARGGIGLVEETQIRKEHKEKLEQAEWACLIRAAENSVHYLEGLIQRIRLGLELDWSTLEPFLRDLTPDRPKSPHGTQVAGILAANWRDGQDNSQLEGICPDIELIDLRVSDHEGRIAEFEVIAALQFLLHLNSRSEVRYVHGVNLSLSIRPDFRSFGCGQTRICTMAEQLVSSGVVVVVAAGNGGTIRYQTAAGDELVGYQTTSITDPGNAENVITVGATHGEYPHQYGVSYFSSRGPTGDGRQKPNLVAPGEKITTAGLGLTTCVVDGTSFAAPHVSGAAALLMARHEGLMGHPIRTKQVLCNTATDLGRHPDFQGCGMLDVLRALQSI